MSARKTRSSALRAAFVGASVAFVATTLWFSPPAWAYALLGYKWALTPVIVYLNPSNADVSASAAESAVKVGMNAWNGRTTFQYAYGGRVGDTATSVDGRNVVMFRNASSGGAIATSYGWVSGGKLVDADVVFWSGDWTFFAGTTGCSSGAYIEDIAAHELGHALGLKHSSVTDATMYTPYTRCSQAPRTLATDDILGLKALYPALTTSSNSAPTVTISSPANGSSKTYGQSITFSGSATDAEDGTLTSSMKWTSSVDGQIGTGGAFSRTLSAGSHVITASVIDRNGVTGSKAITVTVTVTTSLTQSSPTLTVGGYKTKGLQKADLRWNGLTTSLVDVYRNGAKVFSTANDGAVTDPINQKGGGSYSYKVCGSGSSVCTNIATVQF